MITAQDIGVLAMIEKLTRIWVPEGTPRENIQISLDGSWHRRILEKSAAEHDARMAEILSKPDYRSQSGHRRKLENDRSSCLRFDVDRSDKTHFGYRERFNMWFFHDAENYPIDNNVPNTQTNGFWPSLVFDDEYGLQISGWGNTSVVPDWEEKERRFHARWLPTFRRNCWLCGCNIECSREDRLEWVRGLTSEEIEAWQLKVR